MKNVEQARKQLITLQSGMHRHQFQALEYIIEQAELAEQRKETIARISKQATIFQEESIRLEDRVEYLDVRNCTLSNQNIRYKKALEFYARNDTYTLGVRISMGSAFALHEPIKTDKGAKARKELGYETY